MLYLIACYTSQKGTHLAFREYKSEKTAVYYFTKMIKKYYEEDVILCKAIRVYKGFITEELWTEFEHCIKQYGEFLLKYSGD